MGNLILVSLVLMAAADVELRTVDGARIEGKWIALDAERALVDTPEGRRSVAVRELMNLGPLTPARPAVVPWTVTVRLIDGSTLRAERFAVTDGHARMASSLGPVSCNVEKIRSVRFADAEGSIASQWNRLLREPFDSDVLVVGRGESLNYHRGILRDVSADRVAFEVDGTALQVKRSKVFGLIYYHPSGRTVPGTIATLTDTHGSRWALRAMSLEGDRLKATTPAGLAVDCPVGQLRRLDFSEGKVLYLGQLKPRSIQWTPYLGLGEELPSRKAFFAPLHDPGFDGPALVLDGKRYGRGIALCSRTELEYALPDGYRRFLALAGIDDAFRPHGDAQLIIRGDGRTLIETTLTGTQPPRAIDLDVAGVRRLTILVDFGRAMDLGDHVDLCEARIVK